MHWLEFVVILLVLLMTIIISFLVGMASTKLTRIRGYSGSSKMQSANAWYNWAATAFWLCAILSAIILVFFLVQQSYSDQHRHNFGTHGLTRVAIWLLLIFLFVGGIFLFAGYNEMRSTVVYTQRNAADNTINNYIVTSMILLGVCLLLILIVCITLLFRAPVLHKEEKQFLAAQMEAGYEV